MPKLGETQRRDWADLRDVKTCAHHICLYLLAQLSIVFKQTLTPNNNRERNIVTPASRLCRILSLVA